MTLFMEDKIKEDHLFNRLDRILLRGQINNSLLLLMDFQNKIAFQETMGLFILTMRVTTTIYMIFIVILSNLQIFHQTLLLLTENSPYLHSMCNLIQALILMSIHWDPLLLEKLLVVRTTSTTICMALAMDYCLRYQEVASLETNFHLLTISMTTDTSNNKIIQLLLARVS